MLFRSPASAKGAKGAQVAVAPADGGCRSTITASGEPEIVLEIDGLTLSMAPPVKRDADKNDAGGSPTKPAAQV